MSKVFTALQFAFIIAVLSFGARCGYALFFTDMGGYTCTEPKAGETASCEY